MLSRTKALIVGAAAVAMAGAGSIAAGPAVAGAGSIAVAPAVLAQSGPYLGAKVELAASKGGKRFVIAKRKAKGWRNSPGHRDWRWRDDDDWVGPAIGFGTGFFLGTLLAHPHSYPSHGYTSADAWCAREFQSFNPVTNRYLGYDGHYHHCP